LQRGAKFFGFPHAQSVSRKNFDSDDHFDRCFSLYPNESQLRNQKEKEQK